MEAEDNSETESKKERVNLQRAASPETKRQKRPNEDDASDGKKKKKKKKKNGNNEDKEAEV